MYAAQSGIDSNCSGYDCHVSPVLDDGGAVTVFRIPSEEGYFPTGYCAAPPLVCLKSATLYQTHPRFVSKGATVSAEMVTDSDGGLMKEIACGEFVVRDPSPGTATEVSLVGSCDGISFYLTSDDEAVRLSENEFVLMLPNDCVLVDLSSKNALPDVILHLEGLLAARTNFRDASGETKLGEPELDRAVLVPDDRLSRAIFKTSKWVGKAAEKAGKAGSRQIDRYGEKKVASIQNTEEKKIGKNTLRLAKGTKFVAKKTNLVADTVSDKVSGAAGKAVAKHIKSKNANSNQKEESKKAKKAKQILLTTILAYGEISDGVGEGYNHMSRAAKGQANTFIAKKYGQDAAQLARHTAGATANFGRAALTGRRIINVKNIVKSNAKAMVKEGIVPDK